jgi:uncharacterized protein (TIGR02300 family)
MANAAADHARAAAAAVAGHQPKGHTVAKPEWGTKRQCQSCGAKYYDFGREPIVCPACSTVFDPEAILKARRPRPTPGAKKDRVVPAEAAEAETEEAAVEGAGEEKEPEDPDADSGDDADLPDDEADDAAEDEEELEDDNVMEDTSELGENDEDVEDLVEEDDDDRKNER